MKIPARLLTTRLAAALALPLLAVSMPSARAQITVGGNGSNTTDSAAYSGNQSLTKSGSNTVTLSGSNTYTGGTVVNGGTLALTGSLANNATASITVNNGGTFSIAKDNFMGGHTATVLSPININAGGQVTGGAFLNSIGAVNINGGTLTSTGGSAYWGNLAFVLKGAVTASGDVTSTLGGSGAMMLGSDTVNSVTFSVADGLADTDLLVSAALDNGSSASWPTRQTSSLVKTGAGKMVINSTSNYSGTTTISGGTLQIGDAGTTGTLGSGAVTNNATLAFNRSNDITISNTISGTGSLVQAGTGVTTLSGTNTYTGGTAINGGVLRVTTESQLGASNGAVTLNGGQLGNNNSDLSLNSNRAVTLGASGGFLEAGWGRSTTVAGQIGGAGGLGVVWNSGTVILSGSNTYAGATTIGATGKSFYDNAVANPVLRLGSANALPSANIVAFGTSAQSNTATLDLYGYSATVGGLSGSTNARITSGVAGAATLTTAPSNSTQTFAGIISNGSGTVSLVKNGAGTQILSGANTYTGSTTISGGTLQVGAGGTTGTMGSGSVSNNATLAFNRSNTITVGTAISGTGSVLQQGSGVTEFTVNNSYNGGLRVSSGEAWGSTAGAFGTGAITLGDAATGAGNISLINSSSGSNVNINNTIHVSANGTGTVTLGGRGSGPIVNTFSGNISLDRDVRLSGVDTAARTTFTGGMSGNGGVTVTQGRVTYEGTKTYNGGTTVNSGAILQLSGNELLFDGGATTVNGSLYFGSGGGTETIGALRGNGTVQAHPSVPGTYNLVVSNSDTATFAGTIVNGGGAVALTKAGNGTQILSGANTYSGSTTISGGTLQVGAGGTTGTLGSGSVTTNATLAFNRSNTITVGTAISGTGSVLQQGTGVVEFTTASTYTGGLKVSSGEAWGSTAGAFGTGAVTLGDAATGAGNISLINSSTSSSVTINNAINVSANGTGTVTLGGRGTGAAVNIFSGNISLGRDVRLSGVDTTARTTFTGAMSGNGGVTVTQGRVTYEGTKTYTGGTTVNSGAILQLSSNELLVDGSAVTVNGSLYFGSGGGTETIGALRGNGTVQAHPSVPGTYNLAVSNSDTATFAGTIVNGGGTVALTKAGSGTQILSGANTYTGGTTISGGTLSLSANNRLADSGAVTINSGGTFNLGTYGDYIGTLVMNGNATVAGSSGAGGGQFILTEGLVGSPSLKTLTATGANNTIQTNIGISSQYGGVGGNANLRFDVVGASGSLTVGGVIADKSFDGGGSATSGAISKLGAGTLILDANNTYTGGVTITSGTIQVGTGGTNGNITGNDAAISNNGTLVINRSGAFGLGNAISGNGSLVQAGAGTTTVSGSNSYTGGTTVNAGTLRLASANRLADSGAVTVSGGSLDLGGFSDSVGVVALTSGSIANGTLTGSSYNLQAGSVSAVLAGSGALTKNGSGTATLSGANTYTGSTTINGGTLATSGNNRLATGNSVTVNSGGTFQLGGNQTLASVAGGGMIQLGDYTLNTGASNSTLSGAMAGNGGLTKSGAGTFTLSGQSTFTGDTNITGGTLVLANANALTSDAVVLMQAGTTLTLNQRTFIGALDQGGGTVNGPGELVSTLTLTSNGSLNAVLADGPDYAAGILKRTSGTTSIGAANTFTGAVKIQGGMLQLSGNGSFAAGSSLVMSAGATMDLNNKSQTFSAVTGQGGTIAMGSGSLTVNNSGADDYNGIVTGSGSLTKQGAGTLTLGGNNTYSGGTTVSGGKLAGTTTSLKGAITNNAQVEFAQDSNGTYSGNMGGSGALIKSGTGAVTLSGSNTQSGGTTISSGKLIASTANLQGNIANNAEFELAQNTAGTYAGNISGSGALTKSGSGTVTLSGSNTYSGGTTVSGGKLAGTTANLQGDVTNNAAVEFNQASSGTYLGAMSGTGTLAKTGAGDLTLSGTSTYSGATTVEAGRLTVNGAIASTATVQSGASIGGSGRVGGLILDAGSTLAPGNSPGTLGVDGDATWNAGANYNWQVYAANTDAAVQTGAGSGWDFFDVSGTLTLSGIDSSNRFNLNLWSLSNAGPDVNGTIPGWNSNVGSTWLIASADGGIALDGTALLANTNYSSFFTINTAATNGAGGWSGAFTDGGFQVITLGDTNALYLRALANGDPAAVPEPGQVAASILLLAGIGVYVWRKRRKTAKPALASAA